MRMGWALSGAAVIGTVALAQSASANEGLLVMQDNPADWVMPLRDYSSTRYSDLGQINKGNVGDLQVAWTFSTGVLRGHEGGPLVIGDTMYIHTPFPNIVYALDLNDPGRVIWKYEPKQDPDTIPVMCCDTVNRGPAYANGKIFLHQADTTLVALDAQTGEVAWTAVNGDPKKGETGTSAPMIIGDKVLVGISGGEFGVQGHITAYNINDGKMVWRGYSTGPDDQTLLTPETTHLGQPVGKDSGTATWEGDQWKLGGGTTWGWMSYDPELNLVYYGSGNPGTWNPVQRPGDNRWSMTIFARNPDTGVAKWVYQMTPHDEWDYDGVNEMIWPISSSTASRARCWCTSTATASAIRSIARPANCSLRRSTIRQSTGRPTSTRRPAGRRWCRATRPTIRVRTSTPPTSARPPSARKTSSRQRSRP